MQRILDKKLNELNKYKGLLVSRSEESKTAIVDQIRDVMDDLELILQDLEYIEESADKVDLNNYRICRSYRQARELIE